MAKRRVNQPLRVKIENGQLVIRVGVEVLKHATETSDALNPYDENRCGFFQKWRVTDTNEFAQDVSNSLQQEEEDGSTPISDLLDRCCMNAIEDGSIGVEDISEEAVKLNG